MRPKSSTRPTRLSKGLAPPLRYDLDSAGLMKTSNPLVKFWKSFRRTARGIFLPQAPTSYPTLHADGIPWSFPAPRRILAVGDLHGDFKALIRLLSESQFIDADGKWIGEDSHLVLIGDLMGGHRDSVLLVPFLMRLETEAGRRGGRVSALLGNHDVLPFFDDWSGMTKHERSAFRDGDDSPFQGSGPAARWMRSRNAILRVGDFVFVHAGFGPWALSTRAERVNATIRAWIAYYQTGTAKPPKKTRWTFGSPSMGRASAKAEGPLWNRSYKIRQNKKGNLRHRPLHDPLTREELERCLQQLGSTTLVIGHAPVPDGHILLSHPTYGEKVIMVDTQISDMSRMEALLIENGWPQVLKAKGRSGADPLRTAEKHRGRAPKRKKSVLSQFWWF